MAKLAAATSWCSTYGHWVASFLSARKSVFGKWTPWSTSYSSLGRYVFGSEISYNKAPPRLPGLAY